MQPWLLAGFSFCTCLLRALGEPHREYVTGSWSSSFYRPHDVQVNHIGMVNAQAVYFATKSGVSMLHEGLLTPAVEVHDAELTAFHVCHHRTSIFYEILSKDGGVLTIYEYRLLAKESVKVAIFQETVPAKSLACVDNLLLRASRASLLAVSLSHSGTHSLLQKFKDAEADVVGSLAVAFAADVVQHAQIFAVMPRNRSVAKLRLQEDTGGALHLTGIDELLMPGEGAEGPDGPVETASVSQPLHVAWLHGKLLVLDGCSLRQVEDGRVTTLLGSPSDCAEQGNETLSPAYWLSKITQPLGLAVEAAATTGHTILVLTRTQVIQVAQQETCMESSRDACIKAPGPCGWVDDDSHSQRACLSCPALHAWAETQRPPLDPCILQTGPGPARFDLGACGCMAPSTTPPPDEEDVGVAGFVRVVAVLAMLVGVLFYFWRQRQRRRLQDMYGSPDAVQFHTFNDTEGYVRYDSHETFS